MWKWIARAALWGIRQQLYGAATKVSHPRGIVVTRRFTRTSLSFTSLLSRPDQVCLGIARSRANAEAKRDNRK